MARKRDPTRLPGEAGFALIEVLVSSLLVVIVGGAVLGLISASTRSAAQQRARTQAYALAQEDLARMRSMRISSLNSLKEVRTVTLDKTEFEVESIGAFVNNTSGTTSCVENESSPDYARITSTVRQKTGKGSPVSLRSIVSPSNGSLDPTHGSLVIAAINGQATALSGLGVSGSGPKSFSGITDSGGCAIFADLPAGTYTVKAVGVGLIEAEGNANYEQPVQISGKQTRRLQLLFDRPGKLRVPFIYKLGSSTFQTVPAYVALYNSDLGSTATGYKPTSETVGSTTYAAISSLFPFKTPYEVYAGQCEGNKPTGSEGEKAKASAAVPAAGVGTAASQVQMPTLEVTVMVEGTKVKGAQVVLDDDNCSAEYEYTTEANGHQSQTTGGPMTPAVPWSQYDICASAEVTTTNSKGKKTTTTRHAEASNVSVKTLASIVQKTVEITGSSSSGKC